MELRVRLIPSKNDSGEWGEVVPPNIWRPFYQEEAEWMPGPESKISITTFFYNFPNGLHACSRPHESSICASPPFLTSFPGLEQSAGPSTLSPQAEGVSRLLRLPTQAALL